MRLFNRHKHPSHTGKKRETNPSQVRLSKLSLNIQTAPEKGEELLKKVAQINPNIS